MYIGLDCILNQTGNNQSHRYKHLEFYFFVDVAFVVLLLMVLLLLLLLLLLQQLVLWLGCYRTVVMTPTNPVLKENGKC